jgi:hypothetical protein
MNKKLLFGLLLAGLIFVLGAGMAYAGPSPTDGNSQSTGSPQQVFETALFGLGEVDLSTLGVSPTALLGVGPLLTPTSATDGMLIVDDDGLDCPNRNYPTIQLAVDNAQPGDKIKVCRGTYIEQVTIPAGKDGLTLFSEGAFQAIIKAPPVMVDEKAIVRVSGAHNVTIRHFTITGPGGTTCHSIEYGVRVDNSGSALITDNHITQIRDVGLSGCQNGIAVDIGRVSGGAVGTGTVVHNLIDNYQKGGVVVSNTGSSAEVAYNEVVGIGPTGSIAQNGIQVSGGAQADIHHNKVSRNLYTTAGTEATGILVISQPTTRVHHNDVFMNNGGISLCDVSNTAEVSYNNTHNNNFGVYAYGSSSGCPLTSENLIAYNKAFENAPFDCIDETTGTHNPPANVANEWLKDLGRMENKPGLCKQAGPQ